MENSIKPSVKSNDNYYDYNFESLRIIPSENNKEGIKDFEIYEESKTTNKFKLFKEVGKFISDSGKDGKIVRYFVKDKKVDKNRKVINENPSQELIEKLNNLFNAQEQSNMER